MWCERPAFVVQGQFRVSLSEGGPGREVLQWPYTVGGGGSPPPPLEPPPPRTEVTIVGKNEVYNGENLVVPFLVLNFLDPKTAPPPLLIPPAGGYTQCYAPPI